MKERYVKLRNRFLEVIVGITLLVIGVVFYQIQSSLIDSDIQVMEERKFVSKEIPLEYVYWGTKSGSKYYQKGCAAGERIPEENRVYFVTEESAQKYGRGLSVRCTNR